jgi:hypothetical protein
VPRPTRQERQRTACLLNCVALTVYKFDHSAVDGNPEARFKCLKKLVGERGFEPPTPWSRRLVSRGINMLAQFGGIEIS